MSRVTAFIGLGANLGEPQRTLAWALQQLDANPQVRVVAVSHLYRSAPVDAFGPDFLNAVAQLQTSLDAPALMQLLLALERQAGRERPFRNAPRLLDLDLLAFDALQLHTEALRLPHPRLHLRRFVLEPLLEIAPALQLPGLPMLGERLRAVQDQAVQREPDNVNWWRPAAAG